MDRFLPLLKLNLRAMLSALQIGRKKHRAVSGAAPLLFLAGLTLYLSGTYSFLFASQLAPLGLLGLLFFLMPAMAVMMGVLLTLFSAQGVLFSGRDNDLMLSMPVPASALLLSRLAAVWAENLVICLFTLLPAGAAWLWYGGNGGIRMALTLLLCLPLLALLPTVFSAVAGFLLSALTGRLKRKALWNNLLYLVFFAITMALVMRLNSLLTDLTVFAPGLTEDVSPLLFPLLWMERAVCLGDPAALALFAAVCVLPTALLTAVLSPRYRAVLSRAQSHHGGKTAYRPRALRASGVRAALVKKEARKYFNTPVYLFNTGFGPILLLASGVAAPFFRGAIREALSAAPGLPLAPLTALSVCAMTGMGAISGSSISLEGKYLWLLKSSPLSVRDVFTAKLSFALLVLAPPALLAVPGMGWALGLSPAECALTALAGVSAALFAAPFGLFVNLCFPNLDAPNDVVVVKQSAASMLSSLGGMLVCAAVCVPPLLLWNKLGLRALLIPSAVLPALSALFLLLLKRVGERLFRAL